MVAPLPPRGTHRAGRENPESKAGLALEEGDEKEEKREARPMKCCSSEKISTRAARSS